MVAAERVRGEVGRVPDPGEAEEVNPADAQELGGGEAVETAVVNGLESLKDEVWTGTMGELGHPNHPIRRELSAKNSLVLCALLLEN